MTRMGIYTMVESGGNDSRAYVIYARIMTCIIIASLVPLCFYNDYYFLYYIDAACTLIFIVDYIMRWITADYKLGKGWRSFIIYPFTPMAIVDLVSILPSFLYINQSLKLLRLIRLMRIMRVFKLVRYSKSIRIIGDVFKREHNQLMTVLMMAVAYIIIAALIVFNIEPDTFGSFYHAIYWSVISLTTVGYGDIYPISDVGRAVAMVSSLVGIAIIAMPSAIITAGFMQELSEQGQDGEQAEGANAED